MKKTLIIIAAVVIALIAGTGIWGLLLPADHIAASELTLSANPSQVFAVIRDIGHYPVWWKEAERVAPVSSPDGRERWLEASGGMEMTIIVTQVSAPYALETTIDTTDHPPVSGSWLYFSRP